MKEKLSENLQRTDMAQQTPQAIWLTIVDINFLQTPKETTHKIKMTMIDAYQELE